jgi:hypothetical protein
MKNILNIQTPQQPQVVVDQDQPDTMRTNHVFM